MGKDWRRVVAARGARRDPARRWQFGAAPLLVALLLVCAPVGEASTQHTASAIAVDGPSVTANVTSAGQPVDYSFSVSGPEVVEVNATSWSFPDDAGTTLAILNATGSQVGATSSLNGSGPEVFAAIDLPAAGTYQLELDPTQPDDVGSATLELTSVTPISAGGPAVSATVSTPGQQAAYSFTGKAGEAFTVNASQGAFPSDDGTQLYVADQAGNVISDIEYLDGAGPFQLQRFSLPVAGTYHLVVDPSGAGETGSVTLALTGVTDTTGSISANGTPVTASLAVPGQKELLSFKGTAGEVMALEATASTLPDFDDSVSVLDSQGNQLGGSYYLFGGSTPLYMRFPTLPATGTYTLELNGAPFSGVGQVTFQLSRVTDTVAAITVDGSPVTAQIKQPEQREILNFQGGPGEVALSFSGSTFPAVDDIVSILDSSGNTLAKTALNAPTGAVDVDLPAAGSYQIVVDATNSGDTGEAKFRLQRVVDRTGPIALNGPPVTANLTVPGQQAFFTFTTTTPKQQFSVDVTNSTFSTSPYDLSGLQVIDSAGQVIGPEYAVADGWLGPFTIPTPGTYQLQLVPGNGVATGSATFAITTFTNQTGPITLNGPAVTANLTVPGQQALFAFTTTTPDQQFSVDVTNSTFSTSPYDLSGLQVIDSSGNVIGPGYSLLDGWLGPFTIATPGTYQLQLNPSDGVATGSATLMMATAAPPGSSAATAFPAFAPITTVPRRWTPTRRTVSVKVAPSPKPPGPREPEPGARAASRLAHEVAVARRHAEATGLPHPPQSHAQTVRRSSAPTRSTTTSQGVTLTVQEHVATFDTEGSSIDLPINGPPGQGLDEGTITNLDWSETNGQPELASGTLTDTEEDYLLNNFCEIAKYGSGSTDASATETPVAGGVTLAPNADGSTGYTIQTGAFSLTGTDNSSGYEFDNGGCGPGDVTTTSHSSQPVSPGQQGLTLTGKIRKGQDQVTGHQDCGSGSSGTGGGGLVQTYTTTQCKITWTLKIPLRSLTPDVQVLRYVAPVDDAGCKSAVENVIAQHPVNNPGDLARQQINAQFPNLLPAFACLPLELSANPVPPATMSPSYQATREYRGYLDVPPVAITCAGAELQTWSAQPVIADFGYTPLEASIRVGGAWLKVRLYDRADGLTTALNAGAASQLGFNAVGVPTVTRISASEILITYLQSSRVSEVARQLANGILGYDAPFIWTIAQERVGCRTDSTLSSKVSVVSSVFPTSTLYIDGKQANSEPDSNLQQFLLDGGLTDNAIGVGNLAFSPQCSVMTWDNGANTTSVASTQTCTNDVLTARTGSVGNSRVAAGRAAYREAAPATTPARAAAATNDPSYEVCTLFACGLTTWTVDPASKTFDDGLGDVGTYVESGANYMFTDTEYPGSGVTCTYTATETATGFNSEGAPGRYTCSDGLKDSWWASAYSRPTIGSVAPHRGVVGGGEPVTIMGTNFTGASAVMFGTGAATSVAVVSSTRITAITPAGTAGTVDVRVLTPAGTTPVVAADQYTYLASSTAYVTNWGDGTVSQYTVAADGTLSPETPATVATGPSPDAVAVSPDGMSAYVAQFNGSTVSQYTVAADGTLSPDTPATVATGSDAGAIALSADGKSAYVTGYSTVSQYAVAADGTLSPDAPATAASGFYPAFVALSADGMSAYITSNVYDTVSQYAVAADGTLSPKTPATVATGIYPTAVALSADGKSAYFTSGDPGTVSQYTIAADGTLSPMTPATVATGSGPGAVALSADGKSAYVTNYRDDTVSQYAVAADGTLSPMTPAAVATGPGPTAIALR